MENLCQHASVTLGHSSNGQNYITLLFV